MAKISNLFATKNPVKKLFLIALFCLIIFFSISLLTKPIRMNLANRHIRTGDDFLSQKKYLHADLEYKKALALYWGNKKAREQSNLAKSAQSDVFLLKNIYDESGNTEQLAFFAESTLPSKNSVEQVKKAKALLEKKEYQLAVAAAKTATEMDKNYPDTWVYLGIANFQSASFLEIEPTAKELYLNSAREAFLQAKSLDPLNKTATEYLAIVQ